MMLRHVAVSLNIINFLQCVNIVGGQSMSFSTSGHTSKTHSLNRSFSTNSTRFSLTLPNFSSWKTSTSKELMIITLSKNSESSSIYNISMLSQPWSSKSLSTSLIHSSTFTGSSSEYSAVISVRPSKSLESRTFSFSTGRNTPLLSFPSHQVNSSSTPILTSSQGSNFTITTFTIHVPSETKDSDKLSTSFSLTTNSHSPKTSSLPSKTSFSKHLATFSSKTFTTFKASSAPNLQMTASSKESSISFSKEISATSSPRTFSLSSNMSFSRLSTAFSTRMFTGSATTKILKLTSSPMSSMKHSTSFSQRISATSFLHPSSQTLNLTTPVITTALSTLPTVTMVTAPLSDKSTIHMKSSEVINSADVTKLKVFSSSSTKITLSSTMNLLNNSQFVEFDGKLLVSVKYSFKNKYNNLKKVADFIESILDEALKRVSGYIYSKVLEIRIQDNPSWFQCMFKIFMSKSSSETASTLREKIEKYNDTNGFGEFTLHSVETSVVKKPSPSDHKLYLWAIIVIGVLGVACLLLLAALIYIQRKLKRVRKRNISSVHHDSNSNQRFTDIFPSVFDGIDESQDAPLKLRSVSSTESKTPLKPSENARADSQPNEENGDVRKSAQSSSGESDHEGKDDKLVEDQSFPGNGSLQIQDDDDHDDETKFSTFSRKH